MPILAGCILAFGIAVGDIIAGGIGDQVLANSSLGAFLDGMVCDASLRKCGRRCSENVS